MRRAARPIEAIFVPIFVLFAFAVGAVAAGQTPGAFPPASPESQGMSGPRLETLARVVEGYIEKGDAVGAELLVIKNRRTVLHRAFGLRDVEDGTDMTPDTLFNIRSMTKPITGTAIQILIDEGRVGLGDPAAKYLPGFDNDASRAITIEQLLEHRSGLPLTVLSSIDEYPDLLSLANAAGEGGPEFEPASKFWYSDAGTDVLGAIVEVVTGEPLDKFVDRRILAPLGMTDALYVTDMDDPRVARIASLYAGAAGNWARFWGPSASGAPMYPFAWGSQTLYCTPRDYARFLAMWMDQGRGGGGRILSADAIARVLTPTSEMSALGSDMRAPSFFPGLEVFYGQMSVLHMESGAEPEAGPVIIGHSGSDGTVAWAWSERDLMVLYFTQSRGGLSVLRLEDEIDRLILHPNRVEQSAEIPAEFEPYLGPYVANFGPFRNAEFTVLVKNGNLTVDVPGQLAFELKPPDEAGKWFFALTDAVAVSFDLDDAGAVVGMKMYQAGMTFELPKGAAPDEPEPELDRAYAKRCVGTYRDEDAGRDIEILIQNDRLAIKVPEQPVPLELFAPGADGLWAIRLNTSVKLRFDEDENGRIVSFTALLPDGTEAVRPRVSGE